MAPLKTLTVAIKRPPDPTEINETDPEASRRKLDAEHAVFLAQHLKDDLESTKAFAAVGFPELLSTPPDAVVVALEPPRGESPTSVNAAMITMLTLGIVPVYDRFDRGLHFRRVDKPAADFHCEWPVETVVGWLGLALRLAPSWGYGWEDIPRQDQFRRCLATYGASSFD